MTISSTTNTISYTGTGSATSFAVNYVFFGTGTSAELQVVQVTIATGAETVKTNGTDFTVTGGSGSTGTVTAASPPANTVKWVINRTTTQTQETDYVENDPFPAESHEKALDRLTAVNQEQQRSLGRTAQLPDGYTGTFDPTLPSLTTANTSLVFSSDGTAFTNGPTAAQISAAEANATAAAASAVTAAGEASAANPKYTFSTSTSMADPGTGLLRYNNATVASVSAIAIDDQTADAGNPDIEAWLKSWDDSTSTVKGWLRLVEPGTPANYAVFNITGLTDSSGFIQLAVTHIDSNGTFGNGDSIRAMFSRTGDKGLTGNTGSTGSTGPAGPAIGDLLTTRGDIVIRNASTSARLPIGSANRVLISDGTDPAYGQVPLATAVSGTLPLANGGTGATSLAAAGVAALASDQTFTAANRGTITVDNDGSLDLNVTNNWKVTPAGNLALTFTNISAGNGQSGNIIFINSGHTITLHANTKGSASLATTLTTAGTYWISYISDGTNVFCTSSAVFV